MLIFRYGSPYFVVIGIEKEEPLPEIKVYKLNRRQIFLFKKWQLASSSKFFLHLVDNLIVVTVVDLQLCLCFDIYSSIGRISSALLPIPLSADAYSPAENLIISNNSLFKLQLDLQYLSVYDSVEFISILMRRHNNKKLLLSELLNLTCSQVSSSTMGKIFSFFEAKKTVGKELKKSVYRNASQAESILFTSLESGSSSKISSRSVTHSLLPSSAKSSVFAPDYFESSNLVLDKLEKQCNSVCISMITCEELIEHVLIPLTSNKVNQVLKSRKLRAFIKKQF